MRPLTDEELHVVVEQGESPRVEFKATLNPETAKDIREAVCSFSNDLPGSGLPGIVVVGLRDDKSPSGIPVDDQLLRNLVDIKTEGRTLPPPAMLVEKRELRGAEVALVTVWPDDSPPIRFDGRIWVRIGPRRGIATAQDERILNERRRHGDRPYELHPVRWSAMADLDTAWFQYAYLPKAVAPEVLAANARTLEERLAAMKMAYSADDPIPTVLGLLVLHHKPSHFIPGAYIQFLRLAGRDLTSPILDEASIHGTVLEQISRVEEKLASHNRKRVNILAGPTEEVSFAYPMEAVEQLVRNAVLHRTYDGSNAPVQVYLYADRLVISSPGGPYGRVTAENFGSPGITDYRNPSLAGVFKDMGVVQRFGFGISATRRMLGDRLRFVVDAGRVEATVEVSPMSDLGGESNVALSVPSLEQEGTEARMAQVTRLRRRRSLPNGLDAVFISRLSGDATEYRVVIDTSALSELKDQPASEWFSRLSRRLGVDVRRLRPVLPALVLAEYLAGAKLGEGVDAKLFRRKMARIQELGSLIAPHLPLLVVPEARYQTGQLLFGITSRDALVELALHSCDERGQQRMKAWQAPEAVAHWAGEVVRSQKVWWEEARTGTHARGLQGESVREFFRRGELVGFVKGAKCLARGLPENEGKELIERLDHRTWWEDQWLDRVADLERLLPAYTILLQESARRAAEKLDKPLSKTMQGKLTTIWNDILDAEGVALLGPAVGVGGHKTVLLTDDSGTRKVMAQAGLSDLVFSTDDLR